MKKPRFTNNQIFQVLKEAEACIPVAELCSKHCMSNASFYMWRAKYGGMDTSMMKRMKELEQNLGIMPRRRLKGVKHDPLSVPNQIITMWSIDFMHDALANGTNFHTFNVLNENLFDAIDHAQRFATDWLWRFNNEWHWEALSPN